MPQPISNQEYNQNKNNQKNSGEKGDPPWSAEYIYKSGFNEGAKRGFGNGHA